MAKRYYTTSQAAAELGVTSARVRQMVLSSDLNAEKFGRDLMIAAEAVEAARNRKTVPGPKPKAGARLREKSRASKKR